MFLPGQRIKVTREGFGPLVINGNTQKTVLSPPNYEEFRSVLKVGSRDLVTVRAQDTYIHTTWPKASEVIEAKPGLLHWRYEGQQGTIKYQVV